MTNKEKLEHQQLMAELETLRAENEKLKQTFTRQKILQYSIDLNNFYDKINYF